MAYQVRRLLAHNRARIEDTPADLREVTKALADLIPDNAEAQEAITNARIREIDRGTVWSRCTDNTSIVSEHAEVNSDGLIDAESFKKGSELLDKVIPPDRVMNLDAVVTCLFPKWNDDLDLTDIEAALGRKSRPEDRKKGKKSDLATPGFSANSLLWFFHWLNKERGGALLKESALFSVANVKPFAHLGVEDVPTATNDDGSGEPAIGDLDYYKLKECLHVCIVDVAAMSDMVCVAISAFFAKFCNKWVA